PLVTALVVCGRVGSQIGAEVNAMRITEQIDAMEVSATNPHKFLLSTRVWATTIMVPVLCFYAMMISFFGGFLSTATVSDLSLLAFLSQVFDSLQFIDLVGMVTLAIVYGYSIGMNRCYVGYHQLNVCQGAGCEAD